MLTLLGPAVVLAGFGLYMLTNSRGRYRRIPWEWLSLSAVGVVISLLRVRAEPDTATITAAVLSVGFLCFLVWLFLFHSMYGKREDRPGVGDRFPDFRLPSSGGDVYDFAAAHGKPRLLIFYRGSW